MKNLKKLLLKLSFLISVILIISCTKTNDYDLKPNTSDFSNLNRVVDKKMIDEARAWFEMKFEFNTKSVNEVKHLWEYALTDSSSKSSVVEIPLSFKNEKVYALPECQNLYNETKDLKYLHNTKRLIVETNSSTKEKRAFYMVIIPSLKYLEQTNFMPINNTYKKRDKLFDGIILFLNLNGSIINGWRYSSGKIINKIKPLSIENSKSLPKTKSSIIYCQTTYEIAYMEWVTEVYAGGQLISRKYEIEIIDISASEECWTETNYGGGGGSSGTDGGEADQEDNQYQNSKLIVTIFHGEGGSVTGGGEYDYDEQVTISATTNSGYVFAGWSNGIIDPIYTFKI